MMNQSLACVWSDVFRRAILIPFVIHTRLSWIIKKPNNISGERSAWNLSSSLLRLS